MIEHPTVLVLGAGASHSYGFHLGLQLKAHICDNVIADGLLRNVFDTQHIQGPLVEAFRNDLILSGDMSIDAFLEYHPEYIDLGKLAIAATLLKCELRRKLFDDWIKKWKDENNQDKHWYQLLFSTMNADMDKFKDNQLRIITFNYDRSLEYYLYQCINAKYKGINNQSTSDLLNTLQIVHIYGQLGKLDKVRYDIWGSSSEGERRQAIIDASQDIQIIHQATGDEDSFRIARNYLQWAERIYFLGFGFDRENCRRLFRLGQDIQNDVYDPNICGKHISGTSLGISIHVKRYLSQKGLHYMSHSLRENRFPNSTIYDWMHYCENATFD
jgi:hypothetical protein